MNKWIIIVTIGFIVAFSITYKLFFHPGFLSYSDYTSLFGINTAFIPKFLFPVSDNNNGSLAVTSQTMVLGIMFVQFLFATIIPSHFVDIVILFCSIIFLFFAAYKFLQLFISNYYVAIIGSILFVYSRFLLNYLTYGWTISGIMPLAFNLLLVRYFILFLQKKEKKYFLIASLCSLGGFQLIQLALISYAIIFIYILFYFRSWKVVGEYLLFLILNFLLNAYWILLFGYSSFLYHYSHYNTDVTSSLVGVIKTNSILKTFLFKNVTPGGGTSVEFQKNIIPDILSLLFVVIAVASAFIQRNKRNVLFVLIIIILLLSFSLGGIFPAYYFLFKYFPFFFVFRDVSKFSPFFLLFLVIAMCLFTEKMLHIYKSSYIVLALCLLIISSIIISWPVASGNLNGVLQPINLPSYYYDYYKTDRNSKLLGNNFILPAPYFFSKFSWFSNGYELQNPLKTNATTPVIYDEFFDSNLTVLESTAYQLLKENQISQALPFLRILGVKQITLQEDQLKGGGADYTIPKNIETTFVKMSHITSLSEFGKIKTYQLSDSNYIPYIYIPKQTYIVNDFNSNSLHTAFINANQNSFSIISRRENPNISLSLLNAPTNNISIEYKRVSPVKYKIVVHNVTSPFTVVMNRNYEKGWKSYLVRPNNLETIKSTEQKKRSSLIQGEANANDIKQFTSMHILTTTGSGFISKIFNGSIQNDNLSDGSIFDTLFNNSLPESKHIVINGYANGWVIEPQIICRNNSICSKNLDGSYTIEITLYYQPQWIYLLGIGISFTTFGFCLFLLSGVFYKYIR